MPATASLYDITEELRRMEEALIENGGVIDEEMEERFDHLLDAEEEKTEGYIKIIRDLKATAKAVKEEEDRLKKRRRALESSVEELKDRLCQAMEVRGQDVRETDLGKVRVQTASRRSLSVDVDPEELPDSLKRVSVNPDKRKIRSYLKDHDIDHLKDDDRQIAHLEEPTTYIRIY